MNRSKSNTSIEDFFNKSGMSYNKLKFSYDHTLNTKIKEKPPNLKVYPKIYRLESTDKCSYIDKTRKLVNKCFNYINDVFIYDNQDPNI